MFNSTAVAAVPSPKRKQQSITSIDRVDSRDKLEPRRQPHWKPVKNGRAIGFRRMTRGAPGTWLARTWVGDKYVQEALGDFADLPESERYDAAVEKAKPFFERIGLGGSVEKISVRQAGAAYVARKVA